ncbi:MAG: hypothetical protein ACTH32_06320 [Microbacterium gubbeenense]|uniref:phage tail tube protein n=1 Tax=Microbacterium gubbeenense TaxID=159896 RepID=UPI003F99946D
MAKTLPGFETILLVPAVEVGGVPQMVGPSGLVDYENPSIAALNHWQGITKPSDAGAAHGGNVSCAILDDLTLALDDSDTDDAKTICSKGNSSTLTFYNFSAGLNARRDADIDADGLFNLYYNLVRAADVPYFIVHRVRGQKDSTDAFAAGDEIDIYYVHTDVPVATFSDGEPIQVQQTFIPKNVVNIKHTL